MFTYTTKPSLPDKVTQNKHVFKGVRVFRSQTLWDFPKQLLLIETFIVTNGIDAATTPVVRKISYPILIL